MCEQNENIIFHFPATQFAIFIIIVVIIIPGSLMVLPVAHIV
jgi:hypothetical protein